MAPKKNEPLDAVFVQNASAFSAHDDEITLHGVADATIYFAHHQQREAGHIPSRRFRELWDGAADSFTLTPPAAVISFLADTKDAPPDVVVTLHEPRFSDHAMTYRVEVREGKIPPSAGPCSLFIDALRSPLAAASVSQRRA
jgi:hypothetical protein